MPTRCWPTSGTYTPNNEYTHNLVAIAKDGFVTPREFGLAVSMVAFATRNWEREEELARKREAANAEREERGEVNEYLGKVGDKVNLENVKVVYIKVR